MVIQRFISIPPSFFLLLMYGKALWKMSFGKIMREKNNPHIYFLFLYSDKYNMSNDASIKPTFVKVVLLIIYRNRSGCNCTNCG